MKLFATVPIEKLTLFAVIIIGSFYLFVLPPNSAPDEPMHFKSAYQNVDAALGQTSSDVNSVAMRSADIKAMNRYDAFPNRQTYEKLRENLFKPLPKNGGAIVDAKRPSGVPHPYIYFPQTLGMLLGRALQANPEWLYLFGRLFNLIFYAICVWLSVKITPVGKGVIAVVALYPMAMELAASMSSDVYSMSLAFLVLAQYLRIAYADAPVGWRDLLLLLLTMALLGPPKIIYMPMMTLAFFLPGWRLRTRKTAIIYRILVALVFCAAMFIALYVFAHRADGGVPIVVREGIEVNTVAHLLSDPVLFAKMCKRTLEGYWEYFLNSMIGAELGNIEIHINKIAIEGFLVLSILGAFKTSITEKTLLLRDRIQFPVIFLISALGTAIIFYLSWTEIGNWDISGIQGRYFLPVFPFFLLFAARWNKPVRPSWLSDRNLVLIACCLQVFVLVSAYFFISGREAVS